jgi:hypothetical protein
MQKYKAIFIGNNPTVNFYECLAGVCRNTLTQAEVEQDELMVDSEGEAVLALKARLRSQIAFLQEELKIHTDPPIVGRARTLIRKYQQFIKELEKHDSLS